MVELPTRNNTGLLPLREDPGIGRAVLARAIESAVRSLTPLMSSHISSCAFWANVEFNVISSVVIRMKIVLMFFVQLCFVLANSYFKKNVVYRSYMDFNEPVMISALRVYTL